jgi:hypothetical protein
MREAVIPADESLDVVGSGGLDGSNTYLPGAQLGDHGSGDANVSTTSSSQSSCSQSHGQTRRKSPQQTGHHGIEEADQDDGFSSEAIAQSTILDCRQALGEGEDGSSDASPESDINVFYSGEALDHFWEVGIDRCQGNGLGEAYKG